jgi:hypothetical protein
LAVGILLAAHSAASSADIHLTPSTFTLALRFFLFAALRLQSTFDDSFGAGILLAARSAASSADIHPTPSTFTLALRFFRLATLCRTFSLPIAL